jgi:hypothetical protein
MVADIELTDVISEFGKTETQDFAASSIRSSNTTNGDIS